MPPQPLRSSDNPAFRMKWLVIIKSDVDIDKFVQELARYGSHITGQPVPMTPNQTVINVSGPVDLPKHLANDMRVMEVQPDSTMSYLEPDV